MPSGAEGCIEMNMALVLSLAPCVVARALRRSRLLPAAAVAVASGEAGRDRGTVGGRWCSRNARRR